MLSAAAARPRTSVAGSDTYPDVWTKAAALLQSIVDNHALIDGNERLGWLAAAVFLEVNDHSVRTADNDRVYDLVMAVADRHMTIEEIADQLRQLA